MDTTQEIKTAIAKVSVNFNVPRDFKDVFRYISVKDSLRNWEMSEDKEYVPCENNSKVGYKLYYINPKIKERFFPVDCLALLYKHFLHSDKDNNERDWWSSYWDAESRLTMSMTFWKVFPLSKQICCV